jgi:hypothetical protein
LLAYNEGREDVLDGNSGSQEFISMPGLLSHVHIIHPLGLCFLLVLWIVLFKFTHVLVMLVRHEPLIGWAIGPLGLTVMVLHEPSTLHIWLDVLFPALVSAIVLYGGLFTSLSPIILPQEPFVQLLILICGVLITSTGDLVNALRDLSHPLWGEARILRSIQLMRATWAKIHFTPFGYSYVADHFGSSPAELLKAF